MDARHAAAEARAAVSGADLGDLETIADALERIWSEAVAGEAPDLEPGARKLVRDWGIEDPEYRALGVPVPVLTAIGKELGRLGRSKVDAYLPLMRLLWDRHGREGRIVAVVALGPMELARPELVVPTLYGMAQSCAFWEDCDQLAMKALEPVLRKEPAVWLEHLAPWVCDENKWVRRAAITAIGRLPMVRAEYAAGCVGAVAPALGDPDTDVKRALSFALRTCARGDTEPVRQFVLANGHRQDSDSLWVLSDVVRSLWRKLLPEFADLLPVYRAWLDTAEPKAQRSIRSAIRQLEAVR